MSRTDRKARTRAAILSAAREQFVARGYAGATIRDVAEAAGVGVGTVHAHFRDKSSLLMACFQEQLEGAVALGLEGLDPTAPLLEQLLGLIRPLYVAYARHPALSQVMFTESLFPDPPTLDPLLVEFLGEIGGLFQAALARGEIQRLPEGGALAARCFFSAYLMGLISGLAGHLGPAGPAAWVESVRGMVALQLVGLGADPTPYFSAQPPAAPSMSPVAPPRAGEESS